MAFLRIMVCAVDSLARAYMFGVGFSPHAHEAGWMVGFSPVCWVYRWLALLRLSGGIHGSA